MGAPHRRSRSLLRLVALACSVGAIALATPGAGAVAPSVHWVRHVATTGFDEVRAVAATGQAVFAAGQTDGGFGQANLGPYDGFVRRLGVGGTTVWTRQFGTASTENVDGVAATGNRVYVAGSTQGGFPMQPNLAGTDAYVTAFDADGDLQWTRQFGTATDDVAYGVAADGSGVYVLGWTGAALPGESYAGGVDSFVRKYGPDGTVLWTRQFGTSGDDYGNDVAVNSSGVFVVGQTSGGFPGQPNPMGTDAFAGRFDTGDGGGGWIHQLGSDGGDYGFGVAAVRGAAYVGVNTTGDMPGHYHIGPGVDVYLARLSSGGAIRWSRQFSRYHLDGEGTDVAANGGGVSVAGTTKGEFPGEDAAGGFDGFVRRYGAQGNLSWTRQLGTSAYDEPFGLAASTQGVFAGGVTAGTFPGQPTVTDHDGFVARFLWYQPDGSLKRPVHGYAGGDVYDATGVLQTQRRKADVGETARFVLRIQNDGDGIDTIDLDGCATNTKFEVTYAPGGNAPDPTPPAQNPGATRTVEVRITPRAAANVGDVRSCELQLRSGHQAAAKDVLIAEVQVV